LTLGHLRGLGGTSTSRIWLLAADTFCEVVVKLAAA